VEDDITGVVVDTMEDAIAALPRVIGIDRQKVRRRFEQRFSAARMAKDYIAAYQVLLRSPKRVDGVEAGEKPRRPPLPEEASPNVSRIYVA
jgi:hypothetical protein